MAVQYKFEVNFIPIGNLEVDWNDDDTFTITSISGITTPERITEGTNLLQQLVFLSKKHKVSKIEFTKQP